MMCMELLLAVKAPHDVVYFDGSFATPLVYINQALNTLYDAPEDLKADFSKRLKLALVAYTKVVLLKKLTKFLQLFQNIPQDKKLHYEYLQL